MKGYNIVDVGHLYNSEFINGKNLFKAGPQEVTITGAELATFDNGNKVILSFVETDKKLTLNKTRHNFMIDSFSTETDNWLGQKIMLHAQQLTAGQFAGQYTILISKPMQQNVSVQPQPVQPQPVQPQPVQPQPVQPQPVQPPTEDDQIPF